MNWAMPQTLGFSLQMVTNQYLTYNAEVSWRGSVIICEFSRNCQDVDRRPVSIWHFRNFTASFPLILFLFKRILDSD